jgi:hypothetical protein
VKNRKKKITLGTLSISISTIAILLPMISVGELKFGGWIAQLLGFSTWAQGAKGVFSTLLCSLLLIITSVIIAVKSKENFSEIPGKKISVLTIVILILVMKILS